MDHDLDAEHLRLMHLTTILGNAQLLRRWALRSPSLTDTEREAALRQGAAIEQAAHALQHALESPATSPPSTS